jgi:hypothetical protein
MSSDLHKFFSGKTVTSTSKGKRVEQQSLEKKDTPKKRGGLGID